MSNSIKRNNFKYAPNSDTRENLNYNNTQKFHKSYSTRDVFHDNNNYYYNKHNNKNNNNFVNEHQPFVEFPQTLPRYNGHYYDYAPIPPPHRNNITVFDDGRLKRSRSYADWDENRGNFGSSIRR